MAKDEVAVNSVIRQFDPQECRNIAFRAGLENDEAKQRLADYLSQLSSEDLPFALQIVQSPD